MATLGEIATVIRGAQATAADLRHLASEKHTQFRYIAVANISAEGLLTGICPMISDPSQRFGRFIIEKKCLVLSKFAPFKAAVIEPKAEKYLVGGNMYIIYADENTVSAEYLCAYLLSAEGQKRLHSLAKGDALRTVSADALRTMEIPAQTAAEQTRIADEFCRLRGAVAQKQAELSDAADELQRFLSESVI